MSLRITIAVLEAVALPWKLVRQTVRDLEEVVFEAAVSGRYSRPVQFALWRVHTFLYYSVVTVQGNLLEVLRDELADAVLDAGRDAAAVA